MKNQFTLVFVLECFRKVINGMPNSSLGEPVYAPAKHIIWHTVYIAPHTRERVQRRPVSIRVIALTVNVIVFKAVDCQS